MVERKKECVIAMPCSRRSSLVMNLKARFHYAIQLAGRSATSSRAGPAIEQDSVMEYGLNRSVTSFKLSQLVEIARTYLRSRKPGLRDCYLDSVMEFVMFHYAIHLTSWSACELVCNQLASWIAQGNLAFSKQCAFAQVTGTPKKLLMNDS